MNPPALVSLDAQRSTWEQQEFPTIFCIPPYVLVVLQAVAQTYTLPPALLSGLSLLEHDAPAGRAVATASRPESWDH
jgi:hypothetical protein